MVVGLMPPPISGKTSYATNTIYLEALAELDRKLMVSSDEIHATRRLQVSLIA